MTRPSALGWPRRWVRPSNGSGPGEPPTPGSMFVTGGAVAADAFESLDATGVFLSGTAIEEGIPLGRLSGGVADGVPVVTKAGAFGTPGAIRKCIARLSGDDEHE
ncbi:nucleotide-binding domain containing protein [Haloferax sp. KTX1]|uniref:nucleotide-binding domain containing protein n=1 Tax=Haloferax sp. KTX1 TaxID=2600597 RepID=UPI0027BAF0B8|nr:nucleotide-binding domain containing protein [Haloferax sp. KTX1]